MTINYYVREGTTDAITITLYDGDTAADITGYSEIWLFLRSEDGLSQVEKSTVNTSPSASASYSESASPSASPSASLSASPSPSAPAVPGGISVTHASTGVISVSFGENDLLFSRKCYNGYIIVIDGTGKRSSFPNNEEFRFVMRERFTGDG